LYLYNEALHRYNESLNQYNGSLHRVNVTLYLYNEALHRYNEPRQSRVRPPEGGCIALLPCSASPTVPPKRPPLGAGGKALVSRIGAKDTTVRAVAGLDRAGLKNQSPWNRR